MLDHQPHEVNGTWKYEVCYFFKLPKELRDYIYLLLREHRRCDSEAESRARSMSMEAYVPAAPIPSLYGICKQFKAEYEDTFENGLTVTIKDQGGRIVEPELKKQPFEFQRLVVLILAICETKCPGHQNACLAVLDLEMHLKWIQRLPSIFPGLRQIDIKIFECGHSTTHLPKVNEYLNELVTIPSTAGLEVFGGTATDENELSVRAYEPPRPKNISMESWQRMGEGHQCCAES